MGRTHIVTAKDADDLAAAVELHKQPLVEVLQRDERRVRSQEVASNLAESWSGKRTHLLELWLRGRHLVVVLRRVPGCWATIGGEALVQGSATRKSGPTNDRMMSRESTPEVR